MITSLVAGRSSRASSPYDNLLGFRTQFSEEQKAQLVASYERNKYLVPAELELLERNTDLPKRTIQVRKRTIQVNISYYLLCKIKRLTHRKKNRKRLLVRSDRTNAAKIVSSLPCIGYSLYFIHVRAGNHKFPSSV